jgi:hypothetical protein
VNAHVKLLGILQMVWGAIGLLLGVSTLMVSAPASIRAASGSAPPSSARPAGGPSRRGPTMSSLDASSQGRHTATDAIAGVLAAASIALSFVALAERPARLVPVAVVLAIVAGRMSQKHSRLALSAMFIAVVAWVVGLTIVVITDGALF